MKRLMTGLFLFYLLLSPVYAQNNAHDNSITVFAAASLRDVLTEVAKIYEKNMKQRIHFSFAGSNVLAKQVVASDQADFYLSANQQWMDYVQEHKRIVDGTRQTIASNSLVIVAHTKSKVQLSKIEDLTQKDFRYFSMANPEAVPAGKYAKAYFESQKIWQQLVPKIAPSTNVRAALAMVESDPSVIGVVYKTDAATSKKTKIIFEIPADQMPHIEYSAAQIKRKKGEIKHNHFLRFLSNPKAQKIFAAHGFQPIAPSS